MSSSSFNQAQYQQVTSHLSAAPAQISSAAAAATSRISSATGWIPGVGSIIRSICNEINNLVNDILNGLQGFALGMNVPPDMFQVAGKWANIQNGGAGIQQGAAEMLRDVQAEVAQGQQPPANGPSWWQGATGAKYINGISNQVPALQDLSTLAGKMHDICTTIAAQGVEFYVAIGLAVAATLTALAGFASLVGAPVALAALITAVSSVAFAEETWHTGVNPQVNALKGIQGLVGAAWPASTFGS